MFPRDDAHIFLIDGVEMRHEVIGQKSDAPGTLPERGHMNMKKSSRR